MLNTESLTLEILKNIQKDITELKAIKPKLDNVEDQLGAISLYITHTVGLHAENSFKIEYIEKSRLDNIEKRLAALEAK